MATFSDTSEIVQTVGGDSTVYYTTNLKIAQLSGIGFEIVNENLGTGDGSTDSFDLDNGNVIEDSYTIKYSDLSSDNGFTELLDGTDYIISLNGGTVLLTATGLTKTNGKVIFADYTGTDGGPNSRAGGGSAGSEHERVLKPDTTYSITFTVIGATTASTAYLDLFWYEEEVG
jgi:hypothetical protein